MYSFEGLPIFALIIPSTEDEVSFFLLYYLVDHILKSFVPFFGNMSFFLIKFLNKGRSLNNGRSTVV